MTSPPIAYGIDLGTTNSSISVAFRDHVDVLEVEPGSTPESLPSIIFLGRSGNELAGNAAVERFLIEGGKGTRCGGCSLVEMHQGKAVTDCTLYRPGGGCQDARLISGIKNHLWQPDRKATHSWGRNFTLDGLTAIILRRLKRAADAATGHQVDRVVLGYPVAFVGTEGPDFETRQARAETRLRGAAEDAGFTEIELYPEPAAAAITETLDAGRILSVDFGGGTFDAAIIEYSPDGGEVIALKGTAVGGELLDRELFREKVAPALGLTATFKTPGGDGRPLPLWITNGFESLAGLTQLIGERMLEPTLAQFRALRGGDRLASLNELLYGGQAYRFYRAIEDAKVQLSSQSSARIHFVRPSLSIDISITREEFEVLIASHIRRVHATILDALDQAEVQPSDIGTVLRTGGSSRIPVFVNLLETIFGAGKVQERHAFTTVARGLGIYAQQLWAA